MYRLKSASGLRSTNPISRNKQVKSTSVTIWLLNVIGFNAVKCNLTKLTTKSSFWSVLLVWHCRLSAICHCTRLSMFQCGGPSMECSGHRIQQFSACLSVSPLLPISPVNQPGRLHGGSWLGARIASHGSAILPRGWLVTVEITGYPSLPSSIQHDTVVNSEYKPDEADFLAACVAGLFAVELSVISVVGGSVFSLHAGSKRNKSIRKLNQVLRLP